MDEANLQTGQTQPRITLGHLGIIFFVMLLLLGISYMKKPELFSFKNSQTAAASDPSVPHYYAYVTPPEDLPKPEVLGASTNQGPSIIGDDGSVTPVNIGQVLGASTQGVVLSLNDVKVTAVPDSDISIKKYFSDAQNIENGSIDSTAMASALNSGNQDQINIQAQKIVSIRDALQKLSVPESLVNLQKLKIIQYNSAAQMLQNFSQSNNMPDQTAKNLQQFMKSQQDLDAENAVIAQKFPNLDPLAAVYAAPDTSSAPSQAASDAQSGSQFTVQ